jgi:hypothetical protein
MNLKNWLSRFAAAATVLASLGASATPITFIHSGFGSGTLAGTSFTSTAFTITASADTANVQSCSGSCSFIDHSSVSIDIAGLGVFDFLTATRTFFVDASDIVGFSRAGVNGLDLYNGPINAALDGYDLVSSIGPVSGIGQLLQWTSGFGVVDTNGGVLVFANGSSDGTFQAITKGTVPEPGTLALVGTLLLGLAALRRRSV